MDPVLKMIRCSMLIVLITVYLCFIIWYMINDSKYSRLTLSLSFEVTLCRHSSLFYRTYMDFTWFSCSNVVYLRPLISLIVLACSRILFGLSLGQLRNQYWALVIRWRISKGPCCLKVFLYCSSRWNDTLYILHELPRFRFGLGICFGLTF